MRRILLHCVERVENVYAYGLPWKYDATCFNFKSPKELISLSDIDTITGQTDIGTLVIGCDLEDYSFIESMTGLRQLYIYSGQNIRNLDFVKKLVNLSQLFVANSKVEEIEGLIALITEQKKMRDAEPDLSEKISIGLKAICIETECKSVRKAQIEKPGLAIAEIIIKPPSK